MLGAQVLGVGQQRVGQVDRGQRGVGVQAADLARRSRASTACSSERRAEQVIGQPQDLPVGELPVVAAGDGLELAAARTAGWLPSRAYSTAMKWLLPDPNDPVR